MKNFATRDYMWTLSRDLQADLVPLVDANYV